MVKASSKWFICIDLLSGYHQIAIKKTDRRFFTFMLDEGGKQGGCYQYTVAPMGFVNSGHYFVKSLSLLLADLEVLSEVDDLLLEGDNEEEVLKKFEKLLERCRARLFAYERFVPILHSYIHLRIVHPSSRSQLIHQYILIPRTQFPHSLRKMRWWPG